MQCEIQELWYTNLFGLLVDKQQTLNFGLEKQCLSIKIWPLSIAESTGQSLEQVQEDIYRDCYTYPVDALKYGWIDGVTTQVSIIPLMPIQDQVKSTLSYDALPKIS